MKEDRKRKKYNKGITLIALVITIIVLLILAGVGISTLAGEGGILTKAKEAEEKHKEAEEEEKNNLDKLYSSIKVATDDNAEITISMKDLKSFIAEQMGIEGIQEKSLLMTSINTSLEVGTINLKSFTNTFHDKFAEYFEYNETTGELTCNKSGEYIVTLDLDASGYGSGYTAGYVHCYANNINVGSVYAIIATNSNSSRDGNSIRVFLKKGDKLTFSKITNNAKPTTRNKISIQLIKI